MGPIRSLSGMIEDVNEQTAEGERLLRRLRDANRKLTGGCAEPPAQLKDASSSKAERDPIEVPLMVRLTVVLEVHRQVLNAIREEVTYLENHSETATDVGESTVKAGFGQR